MIVQRIGVREESPLDAAAAFYRGLLPATRAAMSANEEDLLLIFEPTDYTHRAWRLAAVQQLARDNAPRRVNGIESADPAAMAAARDFLAAAPGVTGQYLVLDSQGAGAVVDEGA